MLTLNVKLAISVSCVDCSEVHCITSFLFESSFSLRFCQKTRRKRDWCYAITFGTVSETFLFANNNTYLASPIYVVDAVAMGNGCTATRLCVNHWQIFNCYLYHIDVLKRLYQLSFISK